MVNEPEWNTTYWNFGKVKENSELEFNFVYYKGKIRSVDTSCGCTAIMRSSNKVTAILKTGKVHTEKSKLKRVTLSVTTDDGLVHKLILKATVIKDD